MIESEAIKYLEFLKTKIHPNGHNDNCVDVAIKALEEIQEYRALGTVEELREAIEKQRAKKPIDSGLGFLYSECPNCSCGLLFEGNEYTKHNYCVECGQAIGWSEEE